MSSVLHVYNTLNRSLEPVVPEDPARVTFYSCGPTVYDDAHIGNFRSFLAADVLRRWIESPLCALANDSESQRGGAARARSGRSVIHVMNITDVGHMTDDAEGGESGEDRMVVAGRRIAEAKKAGTLPPDTSVDPADPYQIARFYEDRFKADARKLGLKMAIEAERDATLMPRATENIPGMIAAISRLIRTGHAYVVGEPGGGGAWCTSACARFRRTAAFRETLSTRSAPGRADASPPTTSRTKSIPPTSCSGKRTRATS